MKRSSRYWLQFCESESFELFVHDEDDEGDDDEVDDLGDEVAVEEDRWLSRDR